MVKRITIAAMAASVLATSAVAGQIEESIKATLAPTIRLPIESVAKSGFSADLYEVITPQGIFYTDQAASFFIANAVAVNTRTLENMTEKRWASLGTFDFSKLPLSDAIKTVKGSGKRVLVTFEDPNCGYCKKLVPEIDKLDNVTVYTFLYPVLGPDSTAKAKSIWCAKDSAGAWRDYMMHNTISHGAECADPVARNIALGQKLRIRGTPAILFASGERMPGFAPMEKIEEKLARQ
jgi:thiol:disulfide interchange protein DsbC